MPSSETTPSLTDVVLTPIRSEYVALLDQLAAVSSSLGVRRVFITLDLPDPTKSLFVRGESAGGRCSMLFRSLVAEDPVKGSLEKPIFGAE